jgi:colanic acid biosynthesis glycosyl transferase WcaI
MKQLVEDLRNHGHKIHVITTLPHYNENHIAKGYRGKLCAKRKENGVVVWRLYLLVPRKKTWLFGRTLNYLTWNILSVLACILSPKPDVLFIPSPPLTNGLVGLLVSKMKGLPFIYNVQDIYPDIAVRLGILRGKRSVRFFERIERHVYSKAAAITVISEGFQRNLLAKGVAEDKIHVIPNFADTDHIRPLPRRNAFRAARSLEGRFIALFAGNIGLSQGLERVLEAASLLEGHPNILFLFVGNGAAKPALLGQSERLGLKNVMFHPFFPYRDVPEMYASSDVCLVPLKSGISEASVPSKVFSILAAARPIIASVDENSDTWRLVREAECGLCLPPEDPQAMTDAIIHLYHDRELRDRMGAKGREYVEEHYSRKRIAGKYEKLFMSIVGKGALSGR